MVMFTSRLLDGDVRAWDTNDNDFSQTYIPPQPLKWSRVYSINHQMKGNLYVENGLYGILYTDSGVFHYIYDQPYRKGQRVWLDFKQTPNYNVWNESYDHREFKSYNQGVGNWNEAGLNFEDHILKTASYSTDMVTNSGGNRIPELDKTTFRQSMSVRIDGEFKPTRSAEQIASGLTAQYLYTTLANSVNDVITIFWTATTEIITVRLERNSPTNVAYGLESPAGSFPADEWHKITVVKMQDQDGFLIYKEGVLIASGQGEYQYCFEQGGFFDVGDMTSTTNNNTQSNGTFRTAHYRVANKGKSVTRQLKTPLVWHSFDEADWDNASSTFIDKGSAGIDLSLDTTPLFQKDGRYNQAIKTNDGYVKNTSLTTELDNLTAYTIECWIKYTDTVANYHYIIRCETTSVFDRTFILYLDTGNLVFGFHDGGVYPKVTIPHASHTIDTDQKWHHLAGTWDGTYLRLYIDGVLAGTSADSSAYTAGELPEEITIGEDSTGDGFDAIIDEVIISDYAKQPHEFGVMIEDAYETGQWYNEYEFDTDEHGKRYRNSNPAAKIEMDYVAGANFVDRKSGWLNLTSEEVGKAVGKAGIGVRMDDGVTGGGFTISSDVDWTKAFTMQFYITPYTDLASRLLFWMARSDTAYATTVYISANTGALTLLMSGGTGTLTSIVDNSFALVVGTQYQVAYTFEPDDNEHNSGNVKIYVDGSLYRHFTYSGDIDKKSSWIAYPSWSHPDCTLSNLTIHQTLIPATELGIFVDTEPLPRLAGSFQCYSSHIGADSRQFTQGYKLKSISPSVVEVEVNDPSHNSQPAVGTVLSWIERGDYFIKWDKKGHPFGTANFNGIEYYFTSANDQPRFALHTDETNTLVDMAIGAGTNFAGSTEEHGLLMFDFQKHNMIFMGKTNNNNVNGSEYHARDGGERISSMIIGTDDGIAMFGYVPQRAVNEMFWNTSETVLMNGAYQSVAGNWFMSSRHNTAVETSRLSTQLNYQRYPKGLYLFVLHGKSDVSTVMNFYMWNVTKATTKKLTTYTSASWGYIYLLVHITEDETGDDLYLTFRYASGPPTYCYGDVICAIPLSNGDDFPLDLMRQSMTKKTEAKILE
jgi:hypothetical protein